MSIDTLLVIGLIAFPVPLTSLCIRLIILITIWWQNSHGEHIVLPSYAYFRQLGFLFYALASLVSVTIVWRWALRRGLCSEIFAFRRLTPVDILVVFLGFLVNLIAAPTIGALVSSFLGSDIALQAYVANSFHVYHAKPLELFSIIAVAPFAEEVLFRGLLVTWMRRLNSPAWMIFVVGSVAFASIHLITYGLAWTVYTVFFGATNLAIRVWRKSLTPGFVIHLLFNARATILLPALYATVHEMF